MYTDSRGAATKYVPDNSTMDQAYAIARSIARRTFTCARCARYPRSRGCRSASERRRARAFDVAHQRERHRRHARDGDAGRGGDRRPPRRHTARIRWPSARFSRRRRTCPSAGTRIARSSSPEGQRGLHHVDLKNTVAGTRAQAGLLRRRRARRRARAPRAASRLPNRHARGCRQSCPVAHLGCRRCAARFR